jgi:type 1 glutamine amidotransferase
MINEYKGARIFYTSLGVPEDFKEASFRQLLRNAVFWTTKRDEDAYLKSAAAPKP